jgi:signal transduction histidine kinase
MRLALKHQIIMAPAVVLCLMSLLLAFLQFTYWDLSVKRQQAKDLKTAYIAIAEADLAAQRLHGLVQFLEQLPVPDQQLIEQFSDLHMHLYQAVNRLEGSPFLPPSSLHLLQQASEDLNPRQGVDFERFNQAIALLRTQLSEQLEVLNERRQSVSDTHREDIDELVAQTTFVSILVLGLAILVGIILSMTFAGRILRRIHVLSSSAERITNGDFAPPPAPETVRDELDALAVSINRMTDQLIRVVAAEKLIEGAEEERRRIAMDIHDQTLADLSAVQRGIEQLEKRSACLDEAKAIETDLNRAIKNLRVVMDNLHPQTLDILGLSAALESLLVKVSEAPDAPEYHFLADDSIEAISLSRLAEVTLYRIAVEAIHNVLRHAHANKIEVSLHCRNKGLVLVVEDNGRGFEYKQQLPGLSGGRGLHNIQERARTIGAQVGWSASRFSSGTRFELTLPLKQSA